MSSNALAVSVPVWDAATIKAIKETVCKGATESQFVMFMEVCRSTGLNPFLKEIYFVPSVGVMAARDGYLRVANQHPQFDGMETRVERDEKNVPIKAVCTVWRKDRNHPVICEAYYSEYRKGGNVWQTYPSAMIAKVAEVLALKRSFAINGVVTEEEIGEQGSKEKQAEYLAEKGLTPYVAPKHEHHQPLAPSADTIRELADKLDEPPQGIKTIEMRHASKVAEADAVLKEVAKPPAKKITADAIEVRKAFTVMKDALHAATGNDDIYYNTLKAYGYTSGKDIPNMAVGQDAYRALGQLVNRIKEEKLLRSELELADKVYGHEPFMRVLGANGCASIDDCLCLASEPLEALRSEIRALGQ